MELRFGEELDSLLLWEMEDEALFSELRAGRACLKGAPHEEVVLCASGRTFAVRSAESTNALLLLSPSRPGTVEGLLHAVLEARVARPRLGAVRAMLARPGGAEGREVRERAQCSEGELARELERMRAVEGRGGRMRVMGEEEETRHVEEAWSVAMERGWKFGELPLDELAQVVGREMEGGEEEARSMLRHYGTVEQRKEREVLKMDARKSSLLKARQVLRSKPVWASGEFLSVLADSLPPCDYFSPPLTLADCFGFAIVEERGQLSSIRFFSLDGVPDDDVEACFAALFAARASWPWDQIYPFVLPLASAALPVDLLFLRYCFVNRMDPKNVLVSKR